MPHLPNYPAYAEAMRHAGLTPLSEADFLRACAHRPKARPSDTQWDHDTESREGWAE